ncbi:UDP-3-O-(3-hydroxymyristoyl)glucosamine N-acyltransferase [Cylindrospermopsis raciborskii]|uniref:UDP-3-O-(3-hydroxymyristoyl)glucosamine N-acyltransferase n=1 Tax=Cylindrospermopsis raciborskii TaxID=77022 RepID=UPI000ADDBB96|nr:UDP-3-O-(3-hydroxymyristoyl)glucosamine N-acyltransferase [Cylindrospermopsis raciborskii]
MISFSQVVDKLQNNITSHSLTSHPELNPEIRGVAAIDEAQAGTITYVEGPKFASLLTSTKASVLILPLDEKLHQQASAQGMAWLATPQPRLLFAQTISLFYQPYKPSPSIHPTAVIDPSVKIGDHVYIGAHVVILANTEIGNGVFIYPNVVIYPDAKIGDRTVLHANCAIHERSQIGADCVIHSGTVIGAEGFGFVPTTTGWLKMEQSGYTVLEDGVEIGCNSAVDRPAVGETRIGKHTKIDNLVQIGHGCQIGSGCAIAGQAGIAGGVKVGNRVILAGQTGIANQVKIGDGAIVSAQAGVHGDIAPGEIVSGSPALPHKLYLKVSAVYSRLPEIYNFFKQLSKNPRQENP